MLVLMPIYDTDPPESSGLTTQKTNESSVAASTTIEGAQSSDPRNIERKQTANVKLTEPEQVPQQSNSGSMERRRSRRATTDSTAGSTLHRLGTHLEPEKKIGAPPTFWRSLYSILTASCMSRCLGWYVVKIV
jgi:hypothetical protein